MNKLYTITITQIMADKIINTFKEHLHDQGLDYHSMPDTVMTVAFNQYIFDTYHAIFAGDHFKLHFRSEKDMNWFLLQV